MKTMGLRGLMGVNVAILAALCTSCADSGSSSYSSSNAAEPDVNTPEGVLEIYNRAAAAAGQPLAQAPATKDETPGGSGGYSKIYDETPIGSITAHYPDWSPWIAVNGDGNCLVRYQRSNDKIDFGEMSVGILDLPERDNHSYGYQWACEVRSSTDEKFVTYRKSYVVDYDGSNGRWKWVLVGVCHRRGENTSNYHQFPDARTDIANH
jgi:hypothetical protein